VPPATFEPAGDTVGSNSSAAESRRYPAVTIGKSRMSKIPLLCRTTTPFGADGSFDEQVIRKFLQRAVKSHIGAYLGSGGSGEGHALLPDELSRLYKIGVQVCGGKVPVNANPPEQHTARATIVQTQRAVDAGVEVVNVYGPASWHGFKPTDGEFFAYYDEVLSAIKHPLAIAPNPVIGYIPTAKSMAEVARRHKHVVAINLSGLGMPYFVQLKDALTRPVDIYVPIDGFVEMYKLGAKGLVAAEANIIPKTFRRFLDLCKADRLDEMVVEYTYISRFISHVRRWQSSTPRWQKMAMKLLNLPGGEGGLREPYRMPDEAEQKQFLDGLLALHIPEVSDLAKAAGLKLPAAK
jgi:4-hydroxy-tetrahydrodipicolinate synthase